MKKVLALLLALFVFLPIISIPAIATEVETITKAGDTASFGSYYGKPIEWQVLAVDTAASKALLISKEMVGYWSFNDKREEKTWETSSIRQWLNNDFYNIAFTEQQKAFIIEADIENKANPEYNTGGTVNTKDKVFFLSADEVMKYIPNEADRICKVNFTTIQIKAVAKALSSRDNPSYSVTYDDAAGELTSYNGTTDWWWLRTSGRELTRAAAVSYSGEFYAVGNEVEEPYGGVRPAIWVDISKPLIASDWAKEEIAKAEELGLIPEILKGADLTKSITRAEFAAVSVKAYEALSGTAAIPALNNPFTDTKDIEVLKAYNVGITTGVAADKFDPDALLNREQAATMLTRVFKKVSITGWTIGTDSDFELPYEKPVPFADDDKISGWAKDSVYFMAANKIINGMGNNIFAPKNITSDEEANGYANATREQALIIAVRMVENLR